jgi:hypothetical protein
MNRRFQEPMDGLDSEPINLSENEALPYLESGDIIGGYRMPWGSNYTFVVFIKVNDGQHIRAIYKPRDGERPLYDFPQGTLYKREYATYVLSRALGWPDVPQTLIRQGPYGVGSMQQFVPCDYNLTYFDFVEERADALQKFAVFDLIVNNADRKAGHCLLGEEGRIWSIDHGLTFHPQFKLRTVMLEFWGRPIPEPVLADLKALGRSLNTQSGVCERLYELISPVEMDALNRRVDALLQNPILPKLDPYSNVPWPWV